MCLHIGAPASSPSRLESSGLFRIKAEDASKALSQGLSLIPRAESFGHHRLSS